MKRRSLVGVLAAAASAAETGKQFHGVWRLISCTRRWPNGRVDSPTAKLPSAAAPMTKPDACPPNS